MKERIAQAANLVASASRIVVFTGAGVSAESGIATFRDALTGLWERYDPEQLATEAGFAADPALVWNWYASRRARIGAVEPNPAHYAIARLATERGASVRASVITQNVDGLHARAGASDVIELHGNIARVKCFEACGWTGDADALEASDDRVPPRCPACGVHARPDVVWFGEELPRSQWTRAEDACARCDLCLVVGTSGLVYPAAGLPSIAKRAGAVLIVVGPEEGPIDAIADLSLRGKAGVLVPKLLPNATKWLPETTDRSSH